MLRYEIHLIQYTFTELSPFDANQSLFRVTFYNAKLYKMRWLNEDKYTNGMCIFISKLRIKQKQSVNKKSTLLSLVNPPFNWLMPCGSYPLLTSPLTTQIDKKIYAFCYLDKIIAFFVGWNPCWLCRELAGNV